LSVLRSRSQTVALPIAETALDKNPFLAPRVDVFSREHHACASHSIYGGG